MRDIKFRGVTPTGCWVKGSLIYHGEQPQIQYVTRRHPDDGRVLDTDWAYVDPKTVGQYTERKDGKDNEIYDGAEGWHLRNIPKINDDYITEVKDDHEVLINEI